MLKTEEHEKINENHSVVIFLVAYLSSYREKATNALYELA